MISTKEMEAMVRITRAFIAADSSEIVIAPRTSRESDGAGGWRNVPGEPLPAISVRLIPQSDKVPAAIAVEGARPVPDFILMAEPGADIQRYDTFHWRGRTWKIDFIHDKPDYELKADVIVDNG
jgi:hypothetical protein